MSNYKPYDANFHEPSERIYEALMTDPEKRAKVLEILTQEGLATTNENASPNRLQSKQNRHSLNKNPSLLKQLYSPKMMNKPKIRMESPSALCRRRALETLKEDAGTRKSIPKSIPFDCLLNGVVGYCEVRSSTGDRSAGIKAMMKLMGATVLDNFTREVTHVVYKDGTFATFQKAKLLQVHLVSVLWLEAVRRSQYRVPEEKFPARGVEDPGSDAVQTIQTEFDDIVQDEYRESRVLSPSPAVNHVTQRRYKPVHRKDNAQALDDDIATQMRVIHNSEKPSTSYNNTIPSNSDSFYSLNSNSSNNDDIVPCSQDAHISLSKTHKSYNGTIESSHVITKRNKKTYQTNVEVTTPEIIDESPEISQDPSQFAKLIKDSLKLPKAQKIRTPESLNSCRGLTEKTRDEIEKSSQDIHLHITTTDESNNATKSSLNSTGRKLESLLVKNPLNNHWRRNTNCPGSLNLESVSIKKKRRTTKLTSDLSAIDDSLRYVTPSRRPSRSSYQITSEANINDEETDEQPIPSRRRLGIPGNMFLYIPGTSSTSAANAIDDEENNCNFAKERNYRKSSAVQKNYEFRQDNSVKQNTPRRNYKSVTNQSSSIEDLHSQETKLKTPSKRKKSSGTKEQIGQGNCTKQKQETPRNNNNISSTSEDELNSEETNLKTPKNSKKLCGTKKQIKQDNSTKQKRKSPRNNNISSSSEDELNAEETNLKTPIKLKIQDSVERKNKRKVNNENKTRNQNKSPKNKTVKCSTEINLIKPTVNLNASQSAPNLLQSINDTNKIEQPKKGRLRKLYNANDSINDEVFNVPNEVMRISNIVVPVKKPKHQVQMLPGFGPKTLSKKARACINKRKAPAATTEIKRAATSVKKIKEKPLTCTDLKSGSRSDRSNRLSSRMLVFESGSSESEIAPVTPSRRQSMRILARSAKKNIPALVGSDSDGICSPPSNKQLKIIGYPMSSTDGTSESSFDVSPRKKPQNVQPLNFDSISENELETASTRKSNKKSGAIPKVKRRRKELNKSSSSDDKYVEPLRRSTLEFQHKSSRQSLEQIRLTQKPKSVKVCSIVCTRLHKEDVQLFQQIVKKLGRFIIEDEVTDKTTHLVAGSPVRTINILRAIARGCWILRHEWLYKSLEAEQWLDEEQYELTEFSPVVQKCRLEKQSFGRLFSVDVFKDVGEIFVCRSSTPRFSDLEELVTLCGGKIVLTHQLAKICVGEYVRSETITCVNEKWILDSITQYKKKSLKNYIIYKN